MEDTKKCKSCGEEIQLQASKCYHCGSSQILFWRIIKISNLLTACLLVVSMYQLKEAYSERVDAKEALYKANKVEHSIDSTNIVIQKLSRFEIEDAYIIASESGLASGGDTAVANRLTKNLSSINHLISKDTCEQRKFKKDMTKLFEFRNHKR